MSAAAAPMTITANDARNKKALNINHLSSSSLIQFTDAIAPRMTATANTISMMTATVIKSFLFRQSLNQFVVNLFVKIGRVFFKVAHVLLYFRNILFIF